MTDSSASPAHTPAAAAADSAAVSDPAAKELSKEEQERQQEEQLNALRVLYAAQHAVKHANESCGTAPCGLDPKPKFDELMKNITFPKAGLLAGDAPARKKAIDSAFVSVCASADKEELELLLTAGANVNAKLDGQQEGAEGFTALMWAAYGGHKDIVDLLIKKGAGLEAKSDRGYTPLILAATAGSVDLIELFLSQVSLHPWCVCVCVFLSVCVCFCVCVCVCAQVPRSVSVRERGGCCAPECSRPRILSPGHPGVRQQRGARDRNKPCARESQSCKRAVSGGDPWQFFSCLRRPQVPLEPQSRTDS